MKFTDSALRLRELGLRVTPTRKKILEIFMLAKQPISVPELMSKLKVNKTTIYREIESLIGKKVLCEIDFGDRIGRYEISNLPHHHHLVCLSCKKVQDITLTENLKEQEQKIEKKSKFKITRHNLEFFGFCSFCQ